MSRTLLSKLLPFGLVAAVALSMPVQAQPEAPRAVLLGVDAAGWEQLSESLGTELAPSITDIARQGVLGKLTGFPGGQKEQWETLGSGVRPAVHAPSVWWAKRQSKGLTGRPAISAFRPAPGRPLWELLAQNGYRTGISGWPLDSGPNAPDYAAWFHAHGRRLPPGATQSELLDARSAPNWVATTYAQENTGLIRPESFRRRLAPIIQTIEEQADSVYLAAVPVLADIRSRSEDRYLDIKYALVAAQISAEIARQLIDDHTLDFVAANLWGLDPILHRSHQLDEPRLATQAWHYFDVLIGSVIGNLSHKDYLFIVSNHSVEQARNHNLFVTDPILLARGPGIHKGFIVEGATLADVAPTLLRLFGIAVRAPGDGRIMQGLFTRDHWEALPPLQQRSAAKPAQSTEQASDQQQALDTDAIEQATLKRMRAIGYSRDPQGPDPRVPSDSGN